MPKFPALSVVVIAYNMQRELPRTIRSLSAQMQRAVSADDYEIIVVDNGSSSPADLSACAPELRNLEVMHVEPHLASISPARAVNIGLRRARGDLIGVLVDGARLVSPGILAGARAANRLHERAIILTMGFHLGARVQMESVLEGYDQAAEDRLLDDARWHEDGYRLFDISVFAGSCRGGWFKPIAESNALFMRRALWDELGGFDEAFTSAGGGYVNLDVLRRAVALPDSAVVTLLGEGTFHQVHGGVATNGPANVQVTFRAEYERIRGCPYTPPDYRSAFYGVIAPAVLPSIARSATTKISG